MSQRSQISCLQNQSWGGNYRNRTLGGTEALTGLPRSGKKFWKMKKMKTFPGQGKVRELHFQSVKFNKMKKVMEKSGNFKIFLKDAG